MVAQPLRSTGESIPSQIINAVAVVAITVLFVLFAAYGIFDRQSILQSGEEAAEQIAEQTALAADGTIEATRQMLRVMAVLVKPPTASENVDPAAVRSALLKLKAQSPHIMDLLIIDADGRIAHWTGPGTPPDIRDRAYYSVHAERAVSKLYLGEPLLSKVHKDSWFFALSEALRDDQGKLSHVLVAIVDVAILRERLGVRMAIPGSTQVLLAEDGTVYTRAPDHPQHVGKKVARPHEFAALTPTSPSLTVVTTSQLDQQERIVSFRRLSNYPMTAAGSVVIDQLLVQWKQRLLIVVGLWLLLSISIVWIARRAIVMARIQSDLANIDSLTGIQNRRSILTTASNLERSQEHAGSLSLLMIDADYFKTINDRFGHLVGDEVLRQLSAILRTQIRSTDIVGRYGGEEFLVLMPDTGLDGAVLVAEKLCETVAAKMTQPAPVTISIGVAATSENDTTLDRALARADEALYRAKAAGRNCVRVADTGESDPAANSTANSLAG